jgi:hypothetical protein
VSAFYRRFRDKDALLHAPHERFVEECAATAAHGRAQAGADDLPIPDLVSSFCALAVQVGRWRRGFRAAAYQRALSDPVFCERGQRLQRLMVEGLVERLAAAADRTRHPDPRAAADFALRLITGVLAQRFSAGALERELVPLSDERLGAEAASAALAYLGVGPEADSGATSGARHHARASREVHAASIGAWTLEVARARSGSSATGRCCGARTSRTTRRAPAS